MTILFLILSIIIYLIYAYVKTRYPNEEERYRVEKFLLDINNKLHIIVNDSVELVDPDIFIELNEYIETALKNACDEAWNYVKPHRDILFEDSVAYIGICKTISYSKIEKIVMEYINNSDILDILTETFNKRYEEHIHEVENIDKLQAMMADKYENEEIEEEYNGEFDKSEFELGREKYNVEIEYPEEEYLYYDETDETIELLEE